MPVVLNRKLDKSLLVLLAAFNILPAGLLSLYNLDILKLASLSILLYSLIKFNGYFSKDIRYATLFFIAILVSVVNMISKGKYMDWTFFYCLNYLNLFLLLQTFQKVKEVYDYIKILIALCICAFVVHLIFYLYPSLLNGRLNEIRMGSINSDASKVRIFIPAMGFIALLFNYFIVKFLYYKKLNYREIIIALLFFISVFVFASVRTYILGVFVSLIVLLILKKLSIKKLILFCGLATVSLFLLSVISSDIYLFLIERFDIFSRLSEFKFFEALRFEIDYNSEQTFGTVYFRLTEVVYVLQNYSTDSRAILFGNIGTMYDFLGVEQEPAPHISVFGVYYLFGLTGLITFTLFFLFYSKMIIRNLKKFKRSNLELLSIQLAIFWFSLFVFSFFGGIYYSELILMVTFVIAASIVLKKQPLYVPAQD